MKFVAINKLKLKKYKSLIPWISFAFACFVILYLVLFPRKINDKEVEIKNLVNTVGKLMVLPDEMPTIATITDLEKLKGQVFFNNASVGDKLLIYTKAQKAILYNPTLNKVVELAPLNTTDTKSSSKN